MNRDSLKPGERRGEKPLLPTWFKVSAAVAVPLALEVRQVRVFVEAGFDRVPYFAPLTDIET